jgi:hypothetical protein
MRACHVSGSALTKLAAEPSRRWHPSSVSTRPGSRTDVRIGLLTRCCLNDAGGQWERCVRTAGCARAGNRWAERRASRPLARQQHPPNGAPFADHLSAWAHLPRQLQGKLPYAHVIPALSGIRRMSVRGPSGVDGGLSGCVRVCAARARLRTGHVQLARLHLLSCGPTPTGCSAYATQAGTAGGLLRYAHELVSTPTVRTWIVWKGTKACTASFTLSELWLSCCSCLAPLDCVSS